MITKAFVKRKILQIMPYSLLSFLIKKKALTNYLNNICENKFKIFFDYESRNLSINVFYCNDIACAFVWTETKEGQYYWRKLDEEYEKQKALYQRKL